MADFPTTRLLYPRPSEIGAATALATMGALPIGEVPEPEEAQGPPALYAVAALGGAAVGGGLVGFVAGGDVRGAGTGALLTSGLAGLASAAQLIRREDQRTIGTLLGLAGLVGVAGSLVMAGGRKR